MLKDSTSEYINIIKRQLLVEEVSPNLIKFKEPKEAVLFGLHSINSYFPTENEIINLSYDSTFIRRLDALLHYKNILKDRKYIWIEDLSYIRGRTLYSSITYALKTEARNVSKFIERRIGIDPNNVIITFTGGEDFYSIMGSFILREKGYIIFPEASLDLPLVGVPDLIVAKLGKLQEYLIRKGIINNGGFLAEIELSSIFGSSKRQTILQNLNEEILAIEVEPEAKRASGGRKQLENYLASKSFNGGILICPGRIGDEKYYQDSFITWTREGDPVIYISPPKYHMTQNISVSLKIAKRMVIFTLLKNTKLSKLEKIDSTLIELIEKITRAPHLLDELL